MKKLILAAVLLIASINAFAFSVDARVFFNGQQAQATVVNQWMRPIVCSGFLRAWDANGNWGDQWMRNVTIMPGQYANIYARTYGYGNYFRDARANINCVWR